MEISSQDLVDLRLISSGMISQVAVCLWKNSQTVAKKTLLRGHHARHKNELIKEVSILFGISHGNIVKSLGYIQSPEEFSIVMEYCMFESYHKHFIKSNLKNKRSDAQALELFPIKLSILRGIATGMEFLHKQPYLHLRLKPENILLNERFEPRISNFAKSAMKRIATLSSIRGSCTVEEQDETLSLIYMAPEHLTNPRNKACTKTDVYAFGILTWQICTDLVPFEDIENRWNPTSLVDSVCRNNKRPNESDIPKFVPVSLVGLMKKCWNPDANVRPEFSVLKETLERLESIGKLHEADTSNGDRAHTAAKNFLVRPTWASVKSMIPKEEGVFRVQYENFSVTVAITRTIRGLVPGFECEARDAITGHTNVVPFDNTALGSAKLAVSYLIQNMMVKGIYPRPLDEKDLIRDATFK